MHELPATRGMLDVALEAAERAGAGRILEIHLLIGDLTTMVDDSVQFYFDILAEGTPADGARLVFRREKGSLECGECGLEAEVAPPLPHLCPRCQGLSLTVTGGQQFLVESIEVEDPPSIASNAHCRSGIPGGATP